MVASYAPCVTKLLDVHTVSSIDGGVTKHMQYAAVGEWKTSIRLMKIARRRRENFGGFNFKISLEKLFLEGVLPRNR